MSNNDRYDELIGQVIGDRYRVLSVVGVGGMSVVFKAEDTKENKTVAVKVLNESTDATSHAVKLFRNESRAISMLSHENIVKVFDMSLDGDLKYIVMELADGQTLKEYMDERKNKLSIQESLIFAEQILLALEHAHEKGVIHRDIKPHNMIVLPDGRLKVTDFGIARTPGSDTISMSDKALGTVYYISPEQASGKETGTYSDIYSVGIMLYEMTTGKLPFEAEAPVSVAMMQISNTPQKPTEVDPEIPIGIEQIILKAMSKSPQERFKSARSMLRAIRILKENPSVVFSEKAKTEEESKKNPFMKKRKKPIKKNNGNSIPSGKKATVTLFPIILGMVLAFFSVLIISAIVVVLSIFRTGQQTESNVIYATVPSLIGDVYEESMIEELREQHFEVEVKYGSTLNDAYGYGEIYNTKPSAGEVKKIKNSTGTTSLILYVNPLEGKSAFGDYTVMTLAAAKTALKNRGFDLDKIEVVKSSHDTVLDGYVFKTSPEEGQLVSTEDVVTLYVSTGKSLKNVISMPKLVGKTKGQAMMELKEFDVEYVTVSNSASVGTVVGQSVTPFTVICPEFCDEITLYISDGQGKTGISELELYLYMPDLVGKTIKQAEAQMHDFLLNGIKVSYLESEEEAELGVIVSQSVEPGTQIPVNYTEEIRVYYGTGITTPEEPTVPEVIAPVQPEITEPEVIEPIIPEPITPEPVTPEPIIPEPVVPEPVTPEPIIPEPVVPEPVTPEPVIPEPTVPDVPEEPKVSENQETEQPDDSSSESNGGFPDGIIVV